MTRVPDTPYKLAVDLIGKLPPYCSVAHALWGVGCDFKSDGNASHQSDQEWTELTMMLRPDWTERIDIDVSENDNKTLIIEASSKELLSKACQFLVDVKSIQPQI